MSFIYGKLPSYSANYMLTLTTLPNGKKTFGCKWVFTVKYKADETIKRYKARLVAKGYT
jgi:hypothetical protein